MANRYRIAWARRLPARMVRAALQLLAYGVITILVGRPRVSGRENIAHLRGPLVLAANHSSHLDTTLVLNALPLRQRQRTLVVAAADYFYSDRVRAALVTLAFGTIPVERGSQSSDESTDRMHRLLEEGWSLLLYPEGTRSRDGRMGDLHIGAAYLAASHGVPLVPIGIIGTHEALPPGSWWPRRGDIRVRIGAAIDVGRSLPEGSRSEHDGRRDDLQQMTDQLAARLRQLAEQLP